jgi:long-chain acyl-CoA synthetase
MMHVLLLYFCRTGDLGKLEEGKYLKITGRLKEQYKLENGKYVVPGPIEAALTSSKFITQVSVRSTTPA